MVSASTFAADIHVINGDKKFFKSAAGNAVLEFIWDNAQYDNKMALEEHYSDLESLKQVAWNGFVEANPSPEGTFSDCFEELGKQVSKLK